MNITITTEVMAIHEDGKEVGSIVRDFTGDYWHVITTKGEIVAEFPGGWSAEAMRDKAEIAWRAHK